MQLVTADRGTSSPVKKLPEIRTTSGLLVNLLNWRTGLAPKANT